MAARTPGLVALLLIASFGAGCVSSLTPPELRKRLLVVGSEVRGLSPQPRVFAIHASTRMEALTLLADARTEPEERLSLALARQVAIGKTRRVHFVVGGPFGELNQQIVTNALTYHENALPGLVLVLVSPDEPDAELAALARNRRVQLIHRPLDVELAAN